MLSSITVHVNQSFLCTFPFFNICRIMLIAVDLALQQVHTAALVFSYLLDHLHTLDMAPFMFVHLYCLMILVLH